MGDSIEYVPIVFQKEGRAQGAIPHSYVLYPHNPDRSVEKYRELRGGTVEVWAFSHRASGCTETVGTSLSMMVHIP